MAALSASFVLLLTGYLGWLEAAGRVFPNVSVASLAVGGLDQRGLARALDRWALERGCGPGGLWPGGEVRFEDVETGRSWTVDRAWLGLRYDLVKTVSAALAAGRRGDLPRRLLDLLRISASGARVLPVVKADRERVAMLLEDLASDIDVPAGNVSLDPRTGEVREGRPGRRLDRAATEEALLAAAARFEGSGPLLVPVVTVGLEPSGDPGLLASLDRDRLATFSTAFDPGEEGRTWNIILSAACLDGAVIAPGGTLSFNETVGPRTPERGYRQAPEIVDRHVVQGVGGGVCQVATTVFNAALLGDLDVVTRHHHSRPLPYIGLGRDATVSYPELDLVIKNPRAFPVILTIWVHGSRLEVSVWGRRTVEVTVVLRTEETNLVPARPVVEVDPDLPPGAEEVVRPSFDGRDVCLWREVFQAGRLVRRELLFVDHYEPLPGHIRTGPPVRPVERGRAAGDEADRPSASRKPSRIGR